MSPRSEEFIDQARDRLEIAREVLASSHLEGAVSAAYYSMLYAAREGGDYEAVTPSAEEARRYVAGAADFLAAIDAMLSAAGDSGE